jgi:putative FmdB family regulatory protein
MPLYEYTCRKCSHSFEALASARRAGSDACPRCGSEDVERLIGLPAAGRASDEAATNCRGDGPPCGAPWCGRKT